MILKLCTGYAQPQIHTTLGSPPKGYMRSDYNLSVGFKTNSTVCLQVYNCGRYGYIKKKTTNHSIIGKTTVCIKKQNTGEGNWLTNEH